MKNKFLKKQIIVMVGLCVIAGIGLTGCSSLQKKFIRKKKGPEKPPQVYHVQQYNITPSIELYSKHYIYWKNWHRQILDTLGDNSKSDARCIQEMISNLVSMKEMLVPEKGDQLDKHIVKLQKIEKDIKAKNLTDATKTRIRRTLEKELKSIKVQFSYRKIGPYLAKEFRNGAMPEAEPPAPETVRADDND